MNNTSKKKQAKTRASEEAIVRAIEETDNVEEARRIQRWLALKGMGLVIRERMQRNAQILTIVAIHFIQKENITECALDAPMVKRCFATTVCGSVFSVERGGA